MKLEFLKKALRCSLFIVCIFVYQISTDFGKAKAAQGLTPAGPIGGTDLNQALLPPTGLYGALIYGYIDYKDWYFGDNKAHPIDDGVQLGAVGLAYVYDTKLFGGSILSSMSIGYEEFTFGFNEEALNPTGTYHDAKGLMDMYTDIFFWSRFFPSEAFSTQPKGSFIPYGLAVGGGFGMTWPTGAYDQDDPYNVGSNHFTFSPSVALTWTTPSLLSKYLGDATQFSTRIFYNYYTENTDADFKNGALLSADFSASQIAGQWQYGLQGTTFKQIADDELGSEAIAIGRSENKTESFNIGPIVQYNFLVKQKPYFAKLKYGINTHVENGADTSLIILVLGGTF